MATPGWKGWRVSSAVHEYSWEIHNVRMPNHAEITHKTHCGPTPPHAMTACAIHALLGVTNIELSMLHVARPNTSTAQKR